MRAEERGYRELGEINDNRSIGIGSEVEQVKGFALRASVYWDGAVRGDELAELVEQGSRLRHGVGGRVEELEREAQHVGEGCFLDHSGGVGRFCVTMASQGWFATAGSNRATRWGKGGTAAVI